MFRNRVRSASIHERQYPDVPFADKLLQRLIYNSKGWQTACGLVMRTEEHPEENDRCQILPVSLLPSMFPREIYQQGIDVQRAMNKLQFLVSIDQEFINNCLGEVAKSDPNTQKFLDMYNKVMDEGLAQKIVGQIMRADYMCHNDGDNNYSLKQIEVNTISVGGLAYAQTLSDVHRITLREMGQREQAIHMHVPENKSFDSVVSAVSTAWRAYGNVNAAVLMVYEADDPVAGEFYLAERMFREITKDTIRLEKACIKRDHDRMHMDEASKKLYLDKTIEIGVIYFRGATDEEDLPSEAAWKCRLQMERSMAVKIPFLGILMADRKKVQQVMARPGSLERFFPHDPFTVEAIRATYVGQWGLDKEDAETKEIIDDAIKEPMKFVLKSQREGGTGTNYFGESVGVRLKDMSFGERSTYVLMERMWPAVHQNYLVRPMQNPNFTDATSELGVFGYLIGNVETKQVIENRATGHLLKTKPEDVHEAGISKRGGVMDTAFLVDQ